LGATVALDMVVQPQNDGCISGHERAKEQAQQDAAKLAARPFIAGEYAMEVLELGLLRKAHYPQGSGHSAYSWRQDGADEQDFGPFPDTLAERPFKGPQHLYNNGWQVAHGSVLPGS